MICLTNLLLNPLIENQRIAPPAAGLNPSGGVSLARLARAPRGYPRNAFSVSERVKPVRFSRSECNFGGRAEISAGLPGRGEGSPPADFPYVYRWDRQGRKGQRCAVTARGTMNSCRVEFKDGFVMITSRNALRKAQIDLDASK